MADFNDFREQNRKWREEGRRLRKEWRSQFKENKGYVMGGGFVDGKSWTGIFILLIGIIAFLKVANIIPDEWSWIYTWPVFMIALGIFVGIRHRFHGIAWLVLMLIGGIFLSDYFFPQFATHRFTWPVIMILLGLFFIFRPRHRWQAEQSEKKNPDPGISTNATDAAADRFASYSKDDYVNATSVFGGTKKNILSKKFKGGEIVNIFGGTELNLSQADVADEAIIETTTIFGGTKLIIPSNWTVKSDAAVIFGGIEDKRPVSPVDESNHRVLRLKGTVIFGGIDIKSY